MINKRLSILLKDVETDKDKNKVIRAVKTILSLYDLKLDEVFLTQRKMGPSEIYVASTEECDLNKAKELMRGKYRGRLPAPITILEYKNKKVLFKGSNRSLVFILKGRNPDCLIVRIPSILKEPIIVSEAKTTLQRIIERQKYIKKY